MRDFCAAERLYKQARNHFGETGLVEPTVLLDDHRLLPDVPATLDAGVLAN